MKKLEDSVINLYEQRLLVFMENDVGTNKYNQVLLNQEQFKKISDAVISKKVDMFDLKPGHEVVEIETSEEEYTLPDLESIN